MNFVHGTRERHKTFSFPVDEASLEVSKQIHDDQRFDHECFTEGCRKKSVAVLYHIKIQQLTLDKTATWNDTKSQRSKIVFNAQDA